MEQRGSSPKGSKSFKAPPLNGLADDDVNAEKIDEKIGIEFVWNIGN